MTKLKLEIESVIILSQIKFNIYQPKFCLYILIIIVFAYVHNDRERIRETNVFWTRNIYQRYKWTEKAMEQKPLL